MKNQILSIVNHIRMKKTLPYVSELPDNLSLSGDLELDSLDLAELTVRIEDQFGVDIFEDGLITKVGEIYRKIQNHG